MRCYSNGMLQRRILPSGLVPLQSETKLTSLQAKRTSECENGQGVELYGWPLQRSDPRFTTSKFLTSKFRPLLLLCSSSTKQS
jgi:hypothetical protein